MGKAPELSTPGDRAHPADRHGLESGNPADRTSNRRNDGRHRSRRESDRKHRSSRNPDSAKPIPDSGPWLPIREIGKTPSFGPEFRRPTFSPRSRYSISRYRIYTRMRKTFKIGLLQRVGVVRGNSDSNHPSSRQPVQRTRHWST